MGLTAVVRLGFKQKKLLSLKLGEVTWCKNVKTKFCWDASQLRYIRHLSKNWKNWISPKVAGLTLFLLSYLISQLTSPNFRYNKFLPETKFNISCKTHCYGGVPIEMETRIWWLQYVYTAFKLDGRQTGLNYINLSISYSSIYVFGFVFNFSGKP